MTPAGWAGRLPSVGSGRGGTSRSQATAPRRRRWTVPVIAVLMGATVWALMRPFDALDWSVLAIPGGGAIQLLRLGLEGPASTGIATWIGDAAPSLAATSLLTVVATAAALRWFRWEPRG
jgi:hypothetical protein